VKGHGDRCSLARTGERARQAGLEVEQLRGVTSDRAKGALAYPGQPTALKGLQVHRGQACGGG
jgi:hypothetical protein